jgi:hypothetical protein
MKERGKESGRMKRRRVREKEMRTKRVWQIKYL